jgi:hypothetical protein
MKRYTPKVVSKWIAAVNFMGKSRPPKPFPGKAPTRIMLSAIDGKRFFQYIGKPSREIKRAYDTFAEKPVCSMDSLGVYVEFDRGGLITISKMGAGRIPTRQTNMELWAYYHPEIMVENLPNWLRYKFRVVGSKYKLA